MYTSFERTLLKLHYFFPVPKNRYDRLLHYDPHLTKFMAMPPHFLKQLLNLSSEKAQFLQKKLAGLSFSSLENLYAQYQVVAIPFTHPEYPKELFKMIDPPVVLYAQGDQSLLVAGKKVSVIGSRKASEYSEHALRFIIPPLVDHQVIIVSGLAKGADAMAHRATLHYGGRTIAVMGHGCAHMYPKENTYLKEQIVQSNLLISEYPPYVPPARWTFPMRNRIISGLSEGIIVTESAKKSGTMSTIEHGLEHGKEIFSVPGPIHSSLSTGTNYLIQEGANPISHGFEVIQQLQFMTE